ncbi:hypothetical protein M5K25_016447 [Dendrobium thyrsiflorum]|uniref:DUF8040 domain-containing protein n=1 Tax=Dendrobium thyrsiflorum TaxID=117978 RepID=A0ABD0US16_DENTH
MNPNQRPEALLESSNHTLDYQTIPERLLVEKRLERVLKFQELRHRRRQTPVDCRRPPLVFHLATSRRRNSARSPPEARRPAIPLLGPDTLPVCHLRPNILSDHHLTLDFHLTDGRQASVSFHPGGQNPAREGTSGPSMEDRIRKMEESQKEILQLLRGARLPMLARQEEGAFGTPFSLLRVTKHNREVVWGLAIVLRSKIFHVPFMLFAPEVTFPRSPASRCSKTSSRAKSHLRSHSHFSLDSLGLYRSPLRSGPEERSEAVISLCPTQAAVRRECAFRLASSRPPTLAEAAGSPHLCGRLTSRNPQGVLPNAKKFRYCGIDPELEDKLDMMFMGVVATGANAWTPNQTVEHPDVGGSSEQFDNVSDSSESLLKKKDDLNDSNNSKRKSTSTSKIHKKKKYGSAFLRNQITQLVSACTNIESISNVSQSTSHPPLLSDAIKVLDQIVEVFDEIPLYLYATKLLEDHIKRDLFGDNSMNYAVVYCFIRRHQNMLFELQSEMRRPASYRISFSSTSLTHSENSEICHGLHGSSRTTSREVLAITLYILSHNESIRSTSERFQHSTETISRYFSIGLESIVRLSSEVIKPKDPLFRNTEREIQYDSRYMPYFKDYPVRNLQEARARDLPHPVAHVRKILRSKEARAREL